MEFVALPVLQKMRELYALPRDEERFRKYLFLLQGPTRQDIVLPIAGFNPMGKALAADKLDRLLALGAEELLESVIERINASGCRSGEEGRVFRVALNLVDDLEGAWSERYTTDFESKFAADDLLKRDFCVPLFWTSEDFSVAKITRRIEASLFRTRFVLEHGWPGRLRHMLAQEVAVARASGADLVLSPETDLEQLEHYAAEHADSEDYTRNFNFFYGDAASAALNYRTYGLPENAGFHLARHLAGRKNRVARTADGNS